MKIIEKKINWNKKYDSLITSNYNLIIKKSYNQVKNIEKKKNR